ncbi:MAG TPA: HDOD domain-containing protein [Thermoleophilia bacterium]|nr:HDOD domain-containing protein [Thermoleophilia bacterium]
MDRAVWTSARRLQSWPAPALSQAIAQKGSSAAATRFVSRHPIHDRQLRACGYELRFHGDAQVSDETAAAATAIVSTVADIGLDALVGTRRAWLSATRTLICSDTLMLLPAERVTIQVGRTVAGGPDVVTHLSRLRSKGYRIALTDVVVRDDVLPLLDAVDAVKIDVSDLTDEQLQSQIQLLAGRELEIVAQAVDSRDRYDACVAAGFDRFQGDFFCEPHAVAGRGVPAGRTAQMQLLSALQDPGAGLEEIEQAIRLDVGVGFRLLRFINSAYFPLPRRVSSVHEALVLLGLDNVRNWALLMTFSSMEDRPAELTRTATTRAQMCDRLARRLGRPDPEAYFTAGLFSVLDAFMGMRMEDALASLPLTEPLQDALLRCEGPLGEVLGWVLRYEAGDDPPAGTSELLGRAYLEALQFADTVSIAAA